MNINTFKLGQWSITACLVSIAVSPPLANLFFFIALLPVLVLGQARSNLVSFFKSQIGKVFLIFIAVLISGLIYGIEEKKMILSELWGWRKILCIPLAASFFMNQIEAQRKLLLTYLLSMGFFSAYSFLTYFYPDLAISKLYGPGIIARNHVTQGMMFAFGTLIGLYLALEKFKVDTKKSILFFLVTIALCLNVIFIATGRSGYIALFISLLLLMYLMGWFGFKNKSWGKGTLVISILSLIMLISPAANERLKLIHTELQSGISKDESTSIGLRLTFWRNTIEMLPDQVIFGTGTGGFSKAYKTHLLQKYGNLTQDQTLTVDPHNQYLKLLIEHGIIGLIVFLLLLTKLIQNGTKFQLAKLVGIPILTSVAVTSLFNSHFSTFNEGMLVYLFCGILLVSQNFGVSSQVKPC
ncbi:O-antigen ligase family protein [Polynucleobacter sp. MWH-Loch1C5]|uniref:O-antigen ligase family protein n=1 Tax=Polynucleobacter sp. MWH-Loch1C5 TaxID=2689108 RepID=UPI001C0B0245|nr:O-antigen ligase family protein [Polynucleobacter sp. MWH-Loch1C5]MBU3542196.1 O-antigen ligase family protein [Polynucleobacter sp. MWH-Loch1C5]